MRQWRLSDWKMKENEWIEECMRRSWVDGSYSLLW